jgi:cytochrome c-type biogenesis protein CcmH/NrfG
VKTAYDRIANARQVSEAVVNGMRRWIDALWPLALLVVFLGTFRRTGDESGRDQASPNCEEARASDIATLEQCLELDPRNVELITVIGDHHVASGATDRAETMYRRALSIDPRDGDVHLRLGELLLTRGDAAAARTEGEAALTSQPGSLTAKRLVERAAGWRR